MELTMVKSSTLTLVALVLAVLVGATFAHAWLLNPARPVGDIAIRTPRVVTIVKGGATDPSVVPIEVANRASRPIAVAQSGPHEGGMTHLFGPRGLPARLHGLLWHDASIEVGRAGGTNRFVTAVADTAGITCDQVWARPSAGAATTSAAYFTLTNNGTADELVGASASIAASTGVHETIDDGGVMKMRPVASIALAPGKPVTFKPGGYHVMLMGLHVALKVGDSFPLTLTFAHAQPITVTVKVQAGGASMGGASMPGMH
jgi:copper(I)-binding protein